ncbi:hypothetical protein HAX54_002521 [Datura stramonium]|uniref:Uncharacterized protein n=1 Tax=Datura stramonium TaxID=4076 RepID=A0ABS8WV46_DATST|nr:hypothetical protein [Datura stramonium]
MWGSVYRTLMPHVYNMEATDFIVSSNTTNLTAPHVYNMEATDFIAASNTSNLIGSWAPLHVQYAQTVPTRQLFVEMQRDRSLEQQNADAYDCSNFVDLDWLSSSGNSCEEELLDRSLFTNSPIGGLSSENVVSDIVGETTPLSSEGGCSMNVGISVTSQGTENAGAEASYTDAQSCVVVEELSDSFVRWVNCGETLCH